MGGFGSRFGPDLVADYWGRFWARFAGRICRQIFRADLGIIVGKTLWTIVGVVSRTHFGAASISVAMINYLN